MLTKIMAYEQGELDARGTLELFSELLRTGMIRGLQGSYHRAAARLLDVGYLDVTTYEITAIGFDAIDEEA